MNLTADTYRVIREAMEAGEQVEGALIALHNGDTYLAIDILDDGGHPALAGRLARSVGDLARELQVYQAHRFFGAACAMALALQKPRLAMDILAENNDYVRAEELARAYGYDDRADEYARLHAASRP